MSRVRAAYPRWRAALNSGLRSPASAARSESMKPSAPFSSAPPAAAIAAKSFLSGRGFEVLEGRGEEFGAFGFGDGGAGFGVALGGG